MEQNGNVNVKYPSDYNSNSRLYKIWQGMHKRCYNSQCKDYKDYGGRGISIYEDWFSYDNFREWSLSNGYKEDLTIDRIDNNQNYSPSNCRWVTRLEQNNNIRQCHYLTYNNETHTIAEWARIKNMSRATLRDRINKYGWTIEEALSTSVGKKGDNSYG